MITPLTQLNNWGLSPVAGEGDHITIKPTGMLDEERRDFIRQHRQAILDELIIGPKPRIYYITTQSDLRAALQAIENEDAGVLGLDIETYGETLEQHVADAEDGGLLLIPSQAPGKGSKIRTQSFEGGLDPHIGSIRSIQIATDREAWVFDLHSVDLKSLREVLKTRHFVAYNAAFEHKFLRKAGLSVRLSDAMLMDRVCNGVVNDKVPYRSLATVCSRDLGITLDKALQADGWGAADALTLEQIHYAAMDAWVVARLYSILKARLEGTGQLEAYLRLEKVIPVAGDMMLNGIRFDVEKCSELAKEWNQVLADASEKVKTHPTLGGVNLSSPQQKAKWLQKELSSQEIQDWPRTPKGELSTSAQALLEWSRCPDGLGEFLKTESLLRQAKAFLQHVHPRTGRIHAEFLIAGALSGRYTCRKPNIQNPPGSKKDKRFRELFVADEGNVLIGGDFSQIELRLAAAIAPEPAMLRAFEQGIDLHALTASKVLGISRDSVNGKERSLAKALNFGLLYGMGARRFHAYSRDNFGLDMSLEDAYKYREAFFETYPGLIRYQEATTHQLRRGERIVTTQGGLWVDTGSNWTVALNAPIQGTGAEILNEALAALPEAITGLDAHIVHCVHDELIIEAPIVYSEKIRGILSETMQAAFERVMPRCAIVKDLVDPSIGTSWGALK